MVPLYLINGAFIKHSGGIIYEANAIDTMLKNTSNSDSYGYMVYFTAAIFRVELDEYQYSLTQYWYVLTQWMKHLSVECTCDGSLDTSTMADIGILGALESVALDGTCIDLVYAAPDRADLLKPIESRSSILTVSQSAEIGLGSLGHELGNVNG